MVEEKKGTPATQAKNKYNAKAYDQIPLRVPKGEKEIIDSYAKQENESLNSFIYKAINEKINRIDNRG